MASAAEIITPKAAEGALAPESVVVRFAGDSGDGMQLTGGQFTLSTALAGNDLATFPDFPAEIRAPQGTLFGVSAFQINFGSTDITTAGDAPDVLVAMNPAALKTNVKALKPGRPDHRRQRRVHQAQPRKGEVRNQPAGGWQPREVAAAGLRHLAADAGSA
jgi:2-oxoglutarate ferredoxin oxidoreductase subunit alpha